MAWATTIDFAAQEIKYPVYRKTKQKWAYINNVIFCT